MKKITTSDTTYLAEAAGLLKRAKKIIALTGAGISVESGIDDFRSTGGLWSRFPPDEYATLEVFEKNPQKSWILFRELGRMLVGKRPNGAHFVLAELEKQGYLHGIVTQNIDNLHQESGSDKVIEIHGDHRHLQCIGCGYLSEINESILESEMLPRCHHCNRVLKPNVVLFGESVRSLDHINMLLYRCEILLVVGTSAQVYPAAAIPDQVKHCGGLIYEFNTAETALTKGGFSRSGSSDYFFQGSAAKMLRLFSDCLAGIERGYL